MDQLDESPAFAFNNANHQRPTGQASSNKHEMEEISPALVK